MSIREQALIQTFPLHFEFVGAMNSCYRQVGNAVPVMFAKQLGKTLAKKLKLAVSLTWQMAKPLQLGKPKA